MIWLTWRQFRTQAAVACGALVVLAVVMLVTGLHLRHLYDTSGIATCNTHGDCGTLDSVFLSHYHLLRPLLGFALLAAPLLLGMFWGAPLLARELESGTYRLAWTQSITRARWLAVKVALVGLASIAVAEIFSLIVTWWSSPIDRVNMNRFTPRVFDERGIVAIGYATFAFALGLTAGALTRRTLPAMITTLVAFVASRVVVSVWVRPHLQTPLTLTRKIARLSRQSAGASGQVALGNKHGGGPGFVISGAGVSPPHPADWVLSSKAITTAGQVITPQNPGCTVSPNPSPACINSLHTVVTYQPASRYWPFQAYEIAIFLGLALILVALCFWWVRRRLS
jgi:hypothetical protein